jgi:hypothetical protein
MREGGTILALDMATIYGRAEGSPGSTPFAGSGRFAVDGAGHAAIGGDQITWLADYYAVTNPAAIFIERPGLHSVKKGKSSYDVIFRLFGLCFQAASVANLRGIYDVRFVEASDVRKHFIGDGNCPGDRAKFLVQERCRELGWAFKNPDEADALAIWDYGCEQIQPGSGHPVLKGYFKGFQPHIGARKPKAKTPASLSLAEAKQQGLFGRGKFRRRS